MRLGPAAVRFDGPVMTASRSTQHRRSLPFQSSLQAMRHVEGIVNFAVEPSSARDCLVALRHRPCTRRSGCGELTQRLARVANRRMTSDNMNPDVQQCPSCLAILVRQVSVVGGQVWLVCGRCSLR